MREMQTSKFTNSFSMNYFSFSGLNKILKFYKHESQVTGDQGVFRLGQDPYKTQQHIRSVE